MSMPTFAFDQLSPQAQQKAIDVCRNINTSDEYWYESTDESSHTPLLEILGFENPVIHFSLGYCQGDYAKIHSARFHYSKGFVKKLKDEFPKWTKAHALAEQLQNICKRYFYGYSFSLVNGRTSDFEHKKWGADWQHDIEPFEKEIDEFMYDMNRFLYDSYREEYENLNSDDQVKQTIIDRDYLFFKDGTNKKIIYSNAA